MEAILKELHLEGLGAQLRRERIVPSTILAMTDEQIERLGVSAIGDRVRLRLLCRDFEEGSAGTSAGVGSVAGARPSADAIREERERLFNPRGSTTQSKNKKKQSARTWTVQFVCLADRYQCKIPSATEKQTLHKAGLGVKKIKLQLDDDETSVHGKLISGEKDDAGDMKGFPQLREAGGFEMLHCLPNCRDLTPLKCSWAVRELRCNLGGQSKIYLRPIQRNLSTKSLLPENCCEVKEKCMSCKKEFPMSELRTHSFYMCSAGFHSDSHSDSEGEKIKESHTLDSKVDAILVDDSLQLESSQAEEEQDSPAVSSQPIAKHDQDPVDTVISYCEANNIQNPVEILRCMQKNIVTGRALELESDSETLEGKTNYINVDRMNLLETTFEEVGALEDLRLTLEVSFYGEIARDYGGPRREFFRLILAEIKEKYFDKGIRELLADDYYTVGVIMGLSIVQNGKIPQFFSEDQLDEIFKGKSSSPAIANLQKGLAKLGIYQVCRQLPIFCHIFRNSSAATLTIKKLTNLLKPMFSEEGANRRRYEGIVYSAFCRYLREVTSGRRTGVTLAHVLWFTTGSDEEPLLGFKLHPTLLFTEVDNSFLPLANTCINAITLPTPSHNVSLPSDDQLFDLYDCAFLTGYFGSL